MEKPNEKIGKPLGMPNGMFGSSVVEKAVRHFGADESLVKAYLECRNHNPYTEQELDRIAKRLDQDRLEELARRKNYLKFLSAFTTDAMENFVNSVKDCLHKKLEEDIRESMELKKLERLKKDGCLSVEEEYDLKIRHLDVATRCSRCRFLKTIPNEWGFPNVRTCGRNDGCIFSDFEEKLSEFRSDKFGYKRKINGFESAAVKDGKVYII